MYKNILTSLFKNKYRPIEHNNNQYLFIPLGIGGNELKIIIKFLYNRAVMLLSHILLQNILV